MSRLKCNPSISYKNKAPETRFSKANLALEEREDLLGKTMADCTSWKFISLVLSLGILACVVIVGIFFFLPKSELVVVSVNDVGEARYVGRTDGVDMEEYGMDEAVVKNILNRFVWKTFTISKDSDLMYEGFRETLYFLDTAKRKSYMKMINDTDPFKEVGRITRTVKVETIIPISKSSYQVDFLIKESEITGYGEVYKKMRGIFSFLQKDKEGYQKMSEEEKLCNPLGIYITDYNIVEVTK